MYNLVPKTEELSRGARDQLPTWPLSGRSDEGDGLHSSAAELTSRISQTAVVKELAALCERHFWKLNHVHVSAALTHLAKMRAGARPEGVRCAPGTLLTWHIVAIGLV